MKGCLHIVARIAAGLLATAFVLSLPLSLVAFNIGQVAFSPERMTTLLTETIAETGGLRQMVLESLAGGSNSASDEGGLDFAAAMSSLTPQDREYLGEQLTPPGWAEEQMGSIVGGLYEWIDNDRARPELTVDIGPLKVALLGGGANELVEIVVNSWPSCTVAEMAEMGIGALLGQQELVMCEPPEPLRSGVVGILNVSIAASLRVLPDQLTLSQPGASRPASPETMETKQRIRTVRALAAWSWLLSPAMLGLVMALSIRTWRGVALWWGIPLMLGALLTMMTMVGVRLLVHEGFRSALSDADMPGWIGGMIQALVAAMMAVVFRRVALQSAVVLAAGLVVLMGGLILARRGKRLSRSAAADLPTAPPEPEESDGEHPSGMFG